MEATISSSAPVHAIKLDVERFRTHSDRHGAVLNMKRAQVDPNDGAAHCCMSRRMWDSTYGMEDAVTVGERVTPHVVGVSATATKGS